MTRFGLATLAASLVVLATLAGGCDKNVDLVFHNQTPTMAMVDLNAPPMGYERVGPIPPGGVMKRKLSIPQDYLPAQASYTWEGRPQPFEINKDTKSPLHFFLDSQMGPTGPIGPNTELRQQREIITPPVKTGDQFIVE